MFERKKCFSSFSLSLCLFLSIFFSHSPSISPSQSLSVSLILSQPPLLSLSLLVQRKPKMEPGLEAARVGKAQRPGIMLRKKITVCQEIQR